MEVRFLYHAMIWTQQPYHCHLAQAVADKDHHVGSDEDMILDADRVMLPHLRTTGRPDKHFARPSDGTHQTLIHIGKNECKVRGAKGEECDHDREQKFVHQSSLSVLGQDIERKVEDHKMTS